MFNICTSQVAMIMVHISSMSKILCLMLKQKTETVHSTVFGILSAYAFIHIFFIHVTSFLLISYLLSRIGQQNFRENISCPIQVFILMIIEMDVH